MKEYVIYKPIIIILHTIIRIFLSLILYLFVDLKIYGIENIKQFKNQREKKIILASNHTNELDSLLIPFSMPPSIIPPPIYFVSLEKKYYKNFGWKYFIYGGLLFKMIGAFPAKKNTKNYKESLSTHINILNDGYPLAIYPEGGMSKNGKIQPARGGIGYLAYNTKATIIPIAITPIHNLSMSSFFRKKHKIKIKIGKPIYYDDIKQYISKQNEINRYKQIAKIVMKKIEIMLDDLKD